MATSNQDRAREADALAERARTERERRAFEEIARIWRRLGNDESLPEARSFSAPRPPGPQSA